MKNKPLAFMSYTRFDDEFEQGALTQFREALSRTIRFLSGDTVEIFQDVADIGLGQHIQQRVRESLNESMVLIPIITPNYFKSQWCREELSLFLEREQQLGRNDLIISVYYQRVPEFDGATQHPSKAQDSKDELIQEIARRLAVNWQPFRGKDLSAPHVRQELERIAQRIVDILAELQASMTIDLPKRPLPETQVPQTLSRVAQVRKQMLEQQLESLIRDYEAENQRLSATSPGAEYERIKRSIVQIEQTMQQVEEEMKTLR